MTVVIQTGGERPEHDDGSAVAVEAVVSNVQVRGFQVNVPSFAVFETFIGGTIDGCHFTGDVVLDTGLSAHPRVTIRDTTLRHLLGTTSGVRTLQGLVVDGVNASSIRLHGNWNESLVNMTIRAKLRSGLTVPARLDLTAAVNCVVDVHVERPAQHGVRLTDCENVRVNGLVDGPESTDYDAVHVDGGERVIVRADVIPNPFGLTRSAVNIAAGDRHRILGDLGAAGDYDTAAVIDSGTGTVDQSIVD